jgi:uncharacterized PurR-regulated membrane protein YhhQ (DUF165 family)
VTEPNGSALVGQPLIPAERGPRRSIRHLALPVLGITVVVLLSNTLVQFPINHWVTWGAFVYPIGYLITELTNRWAGPALARQVAWVGFGVAAALSSLLASPRIALASSSAFLVSQMLDVAIFNRLRRQAWWRAPLVASVAASIIDTSLFFFLAFKGTDVAWLPLALGDLGVKLLMAVVLLIPFRAAVVVIGSSQRVV